MKFSQINNSVFCSLVQYGLIAREEHKPQKDKTTVAEGSRVAIHTHIHIVLIYKQYKDLQTAHYFDYICNKHGSYEQCRSIMDTIKYVKKQGDFIEWGAIPKTLDKRNLRQILNAMENRQLTPNQLLTLSESEKMLLYQQGSKLDKYQRRLDQETKMTELKERKFIAYFDLCYILKKFRYHFRLEATDLRGERIKQFFKIYRFLNDHMVPKERQYKSKMLHLCSSGPDMGKTALLHLMEEVSPTYH